MALPRTTATPARLRYSFHWYVAGILALAGFALFQFWGNATRGYINTPSLFSWWARQWFDPASDTEYGLLIVIVSVLLFFWNWFRFASLYSTTPDIRSFSWLLGALALHALGYATEQTRLSILALLLGCAGLLQFAGGLRASRAGRFPLTFMLLAVPVGFLQSIGFYLRLAVSESVEVLLRVIGHPLIRNGTQLYSMDGRSEYDVAAACSGVHSLVALFALGVLLSYLRLQGWLSRILLVALVLPFAFVGNLVRILALVAAGQTFGQLAATRLHAWSGFLVFIVVFLLLASCVAKLARWEKKKRPVQPAVFRFQAGASTEPAGPAETLGTQIWLRVACVLGLEIAIIFLARRIEREPLPATAGVRLALDAINPVPLPEFIGTEWIGQRVDVTEAERAVLPPDTGYSRRNYVKIADRAEQVFVSVVLSGRDRSSIHRPELCLAGQGWTVKDQKQTHFDLGDGTTLPVMLLQVERKEWQQDGRSPVVRSLLAYTFVGRETVIPTHAGMLWQNGLDRLRYLHGERWAYVIVQTLADPDNASSQRRMEEVFAPVWRTLQTR